MIQRVPAVNLSRIIAGLEDLPTLPAAVREVNELVCNPRSSANDLARVVATDPLLADRLLQLVNSSFYGFPHPVSTVTGAIALLGFDAVHNLILTIFVFDMFSNGETRGSRWQEPIRDHSLGCAVAAKVIGTCLRYEKVEELFLAGLLHDIGKILEIRYFLKEFEQVATLVSSKNMLMLDAEMRILQCTHADVGQLLAKRWNLSHKLGNIIAYHHCPLRAGRFAREAGIVHLADILCRALDIGSGGDSRIPALDDGAWKSLKLRTEMLKKMMEEIDAEFMDIRLFFNRSYLSPKNDAPSEAAVL